MLSLRHNDFSGSGLADRPPENLKSMSIAIVHRRFRVNLTKDLMSGTGAIS